MYDVRKNAEATQQNLSNNICGVSVLRKLSRQKNTKALKMKCADAVIGFRLA
jgi:hypothetical protein